MKKKTPAKKKMPAAKAVVVVPLMSSEKPTTLKWAQGLAIFQIVTGVLAAVFFFWLFTIAGSSELIDGMRQGVAEGTGQDMMDFTSSGAIGFIIGLILVALLGSIFSLVAISRRSKAWSITALVLLAGNILAGFSVVTLAIFILMVVKPSRDYLGLSN